jgi:hypothetical protein
VGPDLLKLGTADDLLNRGKWIEKMGKVLFSGAKNWEEDGRNGNK